MACSNEPRIGGEKQAEDTRRDRGVSAPTARLRRDGIEDTGPYQGLARNALLQCVLNERRGGNPGVRTNKGSGCSTDRKRLLRHE